VSVLTSVVGASVGDSVCVDAFAAMTQLHKTPDC